LIKLPFYLNLSIITLESFKQSMMLFPLAVLGIGIGYQIIKIIEENLFYNVLYILIFVSSSELILDYFI